MKNGRAQQGPWLYYAAFLVLGLTTASLGPSLPALSAGTKNTLQAIGNLFPARAGAYLLGSWAAGKFVNRYRGHDLLAIALFAMGVTLLLVPEVNRLGVLVILMVLMGLGMGALDVGGNTLLMWGKFEHPGSAMNTLHFFYGLGSFLSPLILAAALRYSGSIQGGYVIYGLAMLPLLILMIRTPSPHSPQDKEAEKENTAGGRVGLPLILIALFYFLYVGVEVGYGGWISSYAVQTGLGDDATGAMLTSVYWGTFTLSRLISIPLAARRRAKTILGLNLVGAMFSLSLILLWPTSRAAVWGGAVGLGFSMASVFPTMLTFANRHLSLQGEETSWFFISSGLGAMFTPWLMSRFVGDGTPQVMMVILLCELMAAGLIWGCLYSWSGNTGRDFL